MDPVTEPTALRIERDLFNGLMYETTTELRQYQQFGVPNFITSAENGGVSFPYSVNASVRYDDGGGFKVYRSLVDGNTALPDTPANWLDTSEYVVAGNAVTSVTGGAGIDFDASVGDVTATLDLGTLPTNNTVSGSTLVSYWSGALSSLATNSALVSAVVDTSFVNALNVDANTLNGTPASGFVTSAREVQTLANTGLSGGGDLSVDRSLSVDIDNLLTATPVTGDTFAFDDSGVTRKATLTSLKSAILCQNLSNSAFTGALNVTGAITSNVNINADTLGGQSPATGSSPNTVAIRDGSGDLTADAFTSDDPTVVSTIPTSIWMSNNGSSVQLQTWANFIGHVQDSSGTFFAAKVLNTDRTNNATLTPDPELTFSNVPAGEYSFEAYLRFTEGVTDPGVRFKLVDDSVASISSGQGAIMESDFSNSITQFFLSLGFARVIPSGTSGSAVVNVQGMLVLNSTATVRLTWAQEVSDGNSSSLLRGSWYRLQG